MANAHVPAAVFLSLFSHSLSRSGESRKNELPATVHLTAHKLLLPHHTAFVIYLVGIFKDRLEATFHPSSYTVSFSDLKSQQPGHGGHVGEVGLPSLLPCRGSPCSMTPPRHRRVQGEEWKLLIRGRLQMTSMKFLGSFYPLP